MLAQAAGAVSLRSTCFNSSVFLSLGSRDRSDGSCHHQSLSADASADAAVLVPRLQLTDGPQRQGAERQEDLRRGEKSPDCFWLKWSFSVITGVS